MALTTRTDPSRTATLRRTFQQDVTRRMKKVAQEIDKLVVKDDAFGLRDLTKQRVVLHAVREFAFRTDPEKVTAFRQWLQEKVDAGVLTVDMKGEPWTSEYVNSAYKKGLSRAYIDTHREELAQSTEFYLGGKEEFIRSSFWAPESMEKVRLIATRTFEDLKGITASMSTQMSQILSEGLIRGDNPLTIARAMRKQIDKLTRTRARTLARTEVIRAHAEGQLTAFERLNVEEVGVRAEWSTAGDELVCPECAPLDGAVMPIDEARGLIPLHPNCRCAWVPTDKVKKTPEGQVAAEAETVRQDMNAEIDKMIADARPHELPLQCHQAVSELRDKFGEQAGVKYYLYDEKNANDVIAFMKASKYSTKDAEIMDLYNSIVEGTTNGHSFVRFGSRYADPYLRSLKVSQKEINAFDRYLASIYDKVGGSKVTTRVTVPKAAVPKTAVPKVVPKTGVVTKFETAEEYRQYVIQQVEGLRSANIEAKITTLRNESNRLWRKYADNIRSPQLRDKYSNMATEVDKKLKNLRKSIKMSPAQQRKLLNEVDSMSGQFELIADRKIVKRYEGVTDEISSWLPSNTVQRMQRQADEVVVTVFRRGRGDPLGAYNEQFGTIKIYVNSKQTFAHEFGHHLSYKIKGFMQEQTRFFKARTVGEKVRTLPGYTEARGKVDKWKKYDVYAGRIYNDGRAPEVASVGIEYIWKDPYKAATQDPEWFNMIISQLKGISISK